MPVSNSVAMPGSVYRERVLLPRCENTMMTANVAVTRHVHHVSSLPAPAARVARECADKRGRCYAGKVARLIRRYFFLTPM